MNYKLAIFDMDGTILDTLNDLTDSLNYALKVCHYPTRTLDEVRSFVGNGIHKLIERAVPNGTNSTQVETVFETFHGYYKVHCADKTKPYPGILSLLEELRNAGMKTAVVSNKADYAVQELCRRYFDGLFDAAVGETAGIHKKPAPDTVNVVLNALDIDKKDAVYIGDSEVDVATSVNAGMDHCIVSWGFREVEFLKQQGAKRIVDDASELLTFLLK